MSASWALKATRRATNPRMALRSASIALGLSNQAQDPPSNTKSATYRKSRKMSFPAFPGGEGYRDYSVDDQDYYSDDYDAYDDHRYRDLPRGRPRQNRRVTPKEPMMHPDSEMLLEMSGRELKDYALDHKCCTVQEADRAQNSQGEFDRALLLELIFDTENGLPAAAYDEEAVKRFQGTGKGEKSTSQLSFELANAKKKGMKPEKIEEMEWALHRAQTNEDPGRRR